MLEQIAFDYGSMVAYALDLTNPSKNPPVYYYDPHDDSPAKVESKTLSEFLKGLEKSS